MVKSNIERFEGWNAAKGLLTRIALTSAMTGGCAVGAFESAGTANPWIYGAAGAAIGVAATAVSVVEFKRNLLRSGVLDLKR
jgi:hypothetical protein